MDANKTILDIFHKNITNVHSCQIAIETPLRLQHQGNLITNPKHITAEHFLMSVVRRVCSLLTIHTDKDVFIDFKHLRTLSKSITIQHVVKFHNWTRYSTRQQQTMDLGGWVGNINLQGDLTPFMPYLQIAQYTHIGKNTPFGLGKIKIQSMEK